MISIAVTAIGPFLIYISAMNYIVYCYPDVANSAIAANTTIRAIFGAGFPLIAQPFYGRLGVTRATTVLSCICTVMIPAPMLFAYQQRRTVDRSKTSNA